MKTKITPLFAKVILIILSSDLTSPVPIPISKAKPDELSDISKPLVQLQGLNELLELENTIKEADTSNASTNNYKPDIGQTSAAAGYGVQEPNCHKEERVVFEDRCEPFTETTCYTQNKEVCQEELLKNCTGVIETNVERICFDVTELVCSLREDIQYQTLRETYQVQRCFTAKDRICDTIYAVDMDNQDDYQCVEVETPNCFMEEAVIKDVSCTDSVEFHCKKFKSDEIDESLPLGAWALSRVICERRPTQQCYEVPRTINIERCEMITHKYCEKFTNKVPVPYEQQNCHFAPKKICEIQDRKRIKRGKKYTYREDCEEVAREVCDQLEKKVIQPVCSMEKHLTCIYEPEEHCVAETKQHCFMDERVVVEEVCDDKTDTKYL